MADPEGRGRLEFSRRAFLKGAAGVGALGAGGFPLRTAVACPPAPGTGADPVFPVSLFDSGLHKDLFYLPQSHQDYYDQNVAPTIQRRAEDGTPAANGKIGFISLGASDLYRFWGGHKKRVEDINIHFEWDAMTHPRRNPRVIVRNCARGGLTVDLLSDPTDYYWTGTDHPWETLWGRLHNEAGNWVITHEQVQVICFEPVVVKPWLLADHIGELETKIPLCLDVFQSVFPNLKLVLIASRCSAAWATQQGYEEPFSWEQGVACKRVIDAQIDGLLAPKPFLAWGPYSWTDGPNPAANMPWLAWDRRDFVNLDGTHSSVKGNYKWSDFMINWLLHMPWCEWFLK